MRDFLRLGRVILNREKTLWQISFALSDKCNLRCRYCALAPTRENTFLSFQVFVNAMRSLDVNGYSVNNLVLSHSGEILQHPQLRRFLDYLAGGRSFVRNVSINTNLTLMDLDMANAIVSSGAVDTIVCSIDGHDAESFERLRPPAKFDTIKENFRTLCAVNRANGGNIEIVINNGTDVAELVYSQEFEELLALASRTLHYNFHNWGGQIGPTRTDVPKRFCRLAFRNVVVMADGSVAKCCYDLNGRTAYDRLVIGNDLHKVLTSRRRKLDLLRMFFGRRKSIKGCANCTVGNTKEEEFVTIL